MKKKKKGRPSLLSSLQNRSPKPPPPPQQHQKRFNSVCNVKKINPSPSPVRRSTRRNPNPDKLFPEPESIDSEEEEEDERKQRKHKLLYGFPLDHDHFHQNPSLSANSVVPYGSDSNADGEDHEYCKKKKKKRKKINAVGGDGSDDEEKSEKVPKATDTPQGVGVGVESGPMTLLPDKKLLVFILDKLQKKDTHGVFSEPVDQEELPDYHETIEHPMDFRTVRERLDEGVYTNLEQFERDVLLICSNAMEYNASDTIYFRQARSIQELAKKDFEILRQGSDDSEPQPKVVRRGRPPSKNLKKFLCRSPLERCGTEISSDAAVVNGGDKAIPSDPYKGPMPYKFQPADALARASRASCNNESYTGWSSKWENEFPVSVLKGGSTRYSRMDFSFSESRRDTYQHLSASGHDLFHLATLEEDMRQLLAVGLHSEHGYATSLARFAAELGSIVWKNASEKIEQVLPVGLNYGPGWVGEKERQQQLFSVSNQHDNHLNKPPPPSASGSKFVAVNRSFLPIKDDMVEAESLLRSIGGAIPEPTFQIQQKPVDQINSDTNGSSGVCGFDISSGMVTEKIATLAAKCSSEEGFRPSVPSCNSTFVSPVSGNYLNSDKSELLESATRIYTGSSLAFSQESRTMPEAEICWKQPWEGFLPQHRHRLVPFPPDLNVRFRSPSSPTSSVQIGSPHQPDLALQL